MQKSLCDVSCAVVPARGEVTLLARAQLPSRFGAFEILAFQREGVALEHVALVRGDPTGAEPLTVRVHSECLTGDVLGSLRCDCRDQLEQAVAHLAALDRGVLLYLRQEGRGIGLANKVRAYALQDAGLDTFEANRHLGFDDDLRDYGDAADILRALGVGPVLLMTNNPQKIEELRKHGINVVGRLPLEAIPTSHNHRYLLAKKVKKGHLLALGALLERC